MRNALVPYISRKKQWGQQHWRKAHGKGEARAGLRGNYTSFAWWGRERAGMVVQEGGGVSSMRLVRWDWEGVGNLGGGV